MYCNKCGKNSVENSNYCKHCGSKIEKVLGDDSSDENNDIKMHAPKSESKKVKKREGLTGWIALLGLGIIINPFIYGYGLFKYFPLFNESFNIPGYMLLLQFEFVMTLIILLSSIYFLFPYFNKKRTFPKYYFVFLVCVAIYAGIDYLLVASLVAPTPEQQKALSDSLSQSSNEIGRTIIVSFLWAAYLKMSKKVKAVFIND